MNIVVLDDAEETEWVCCLEPISVKVQRSDVVCYMPKASLSNELTGTRAEWQASMDLSWASGVPEGICAVAELQIVEAPSMTAIVSRSQGDKPGAMIMVHINDSQSGEARASMLDTMEGNFPTRAHFDNTPEALNDIIGMEHMTCCSEGEHFQYCFEGEPNPSFSRVGFSILCLVA
eukprot:309291-Amphidinium_carterae.1